MENEEKLLSIFHAVKVGDEATIESLLKKDEVEITKKVEGETALHVAVFSGQEKIVRLLCKCEELLSTKDSKGRTPLHISVDMGNIPLTEILCQNGSPLYYHDREGNTPLLIAVSKNNLEMVTCLVNHGAFNSGSDRCHAINPFHLALQKNFTHIIEILLKHADLVDICSCPSYPDPELAEEIFNRCLEMKNAKVCLKGKKRRRKETALQWAIVYGRDNQVERIIESGVNVNANFPGYTPLHTAVKKRHISIVEYLLPKIKNINSADANGCTPLYYASEVSSCSPDLRQKDFEDSLQIMKLLIANGASVDFFVGYDESPLHRAAEEEVFRPEKIRLLLDNNADVNAQKVGECTPIFYAHCPGILQMLIDNGANVNFNAPGYPSTPLQSAIWKDETTKVEILLENGADINVPIRINIWYIKRPLSIVDILKTEPEMNETVMDRITDITSSIKTLVRERCDDKNVIPILVKRHFQGEVTIKSEEFLLASGMFFSKFKECQEELERMRDVKVLDFSLFDIFAMPIKKLRNYMKNEVLKVLTSRSLKKKFPVYSGMMMRRFKKAREERNLIVNSSEVLKKFVYCFHKINLPDLVSYEIVKFLHMVDLKKLVEL